MQDVNVNQAENAAEKTETAQAGFKQKAVNFFKGMRRYQLYLMLLPGLIYLLLFEYLPIFGIVMAFQEFNPIQSFFGSKWVGVAQFQKFVTSPLFWTLIKNTLSISVWQLIVFPLPMFFALILNEISISALKRGSQTILYASHFISVTVLVGIMFTFFSPINGVVNRAIVALGGKEIQFMYLEKYFVPFFVLSGLWQNLGWNSIIYIGALSSVDACLHEAAMIDGAGRIKRIIHINFPAIIPTFSILFILAVGGLMNVGFDKAFLMQTPGNIAVSNIISTYVYEVSLRSGLGNYSFGTAIGLFNAAINLSLLFAANFINKRLKMETLW